MIRFWSMTIFAALGAAVLVSLGAWQLQRAEWKDDVIAQIQARGSESPASLPEMPDRIADAFRAVRMRGAIDGPGVPVFSTWRGAGAGYRIVAPFVTEDGRRVLLDLGVADGPEPALPSGAISVEGSLHWPNERQGDPENAIWTGRDVPALAARLGTESTFVVARSVSPPSGAIRPVPLDATGISDNHLGYAVQWFGLAAVWTAMAGWFAWRTAPWRRVSTEAG